MDKIEKSIKRTVEIIGAGESREIMDRPLNYLFMLHSPKTEPNAVVTYKVLKNRGCK